jgi:hypothetical protein
MDRRGMVLNKEAFAYFSKVQAHMGKTRAIRETLKRLPKRPQTPSAPLSPEQNARLAAFDAVVKMRDAQWASMTSAERAEELKAWEAVKKFINSDRAGYREVFRDE